MLDEVAGRDRARPDDRELPEADVAAPAGQHHERHRDDSPDQRHAHEVHRARPVKQRRDHRGDHEHDTDRHARRPHFEEAA